MKARRREEQKRFASIFLKLPSEMLRDSRGVIIYQQPSRSKAFDKEPFFAFNAAVPTFVKRRK